MATYHGMTEKWAIETYPPSCSRPHTHTTHESYRGQCRVFCYLLTNIAQLTTKKFVLDKLEMNNFDHSVGVYFYRFADDKQPFIKIGECSSRSIATRFDKGWCGNGTDSYIHRQSTKPKKTDEQKYKPMYRQLGKISDKNPAYFVFYEMVTEEATPKVDEFIAIEHHIRKYGRSTISPHSPPRYRTGANLVWHDPAFDEVLKKQFPSGNTYPK